MKSLLVFAVVAVGAAAAWPRLMADQQPDDVPLHQKQHAVNVAFYKVFEPLRDPELLQTAHSFSPAADPSMYRDGGVAVERLLDQLSRGQMLPKKHWASGSDERHLQEAVMLFEVLVHCKTWQCLVSNGAYFRERLNEEEFIYAAYAAVKHSPLTEHVVLPAIYEVKPNHFTRSEVIQEASEAKEMKLTNILLQNNLTGTEHDPEHRLSYFREDVGLGTHHMMLHLENPSWWNDTYGYHIHRKGENFFYAYHQLLNRYEAERASNHLPPLEQLQLDQPLHEGYAPQTTYKFGAPFPIRNDDTSLRDVAGLGSLHQLMHLEDRIHDAIAHGYVEDDHGQKIPLENDHGIDILGDIIQSSLYSPNRKYYGQLSSLAYALLERQVDPSHKYALPAGALGHLELLPRDPAAWRLHKRLDNIFREHVDSLPPYSEAQLRFPGVAVSEVEVEGGLETFLEDYKYDLVNAFDDNSTETKFPDIGASVPRLNHKEFSYKIHVQNNAGGDKKALVRILALPRKDGNGAIIPFDEARWLAIEMDLFLHTLSPGDNQIVRKSSEASITVPDVPTFKTLVEKAQAHQTFPEEYESATGLPQRLLLPRGNEEGVEFMLVVAVTDADEDVADESIIRLGKYHHYGVHGVQPDNRPFGYPLDRRVACMNSFLSVSNIHSSIVKVYNHDVFIHLPYHTTTTA